MHQYLSVQRIFPLLQKELLSEYEIQAVLEYTCSLNGGRLAYIPVVAGIGFSDSSVEWKQKTCTTTNWGYIWHRK